MFGRVTRKKVCQPLAPSTMAASSSSEPCSCISGISSRAMNGAVMKVVASTMPGTAKMIWMSCSESHSPNQPCAPNRSTKIMPEMTGETAKGRSMRVMSTFLPRNSNLEMHQAAAIPNTRFTGTAMPAMSRVSLAALRASGSRIASR